MLPFGPETMLQRVVRLLSTEVEPIVVVAATGQQLPPLPPGLRVVRDREGDRGPLEGIYVGLDSLRETVDAAYVTSCDVPLLCPALVRSLVSRLDDYDVVVPRDQQYHHPLAAIYRTRILPQIDQLLAADKRRPFFLFEQVRTLELDVQQLRDVDPELRSLMNLNSPEDYRQALRLAGMPETRG